MATTQQLVTPARTYATPSRAVRSVEKMHVDVGGRQVKFVLSKDSRGRYFPVFIDRIEKVSSEEIAANPSANAGAAGKRMKKAAAKRAMKKATKRPAKKAARKSTH